MENLLSVGKEFSSIFHKFDLAALRICCAELFIFPNQREKKNLRLTNGKPNQYLSIKD
jgi:hypothetical protein